MTDRPAFVILASGSMAQQDAEVKCQLAARGSQRYQQECLKSATSSSSTLPNGTSLSCVWTRRFDSFSSLDLPLSCRSRATDPHSLEVKVAHASYRYFLCNSSISVHDHAYLFAHTHGHHPIVGRSRGICYRWHPRSTIASRSPHNRPTARASTQQRQTLHMHHRWHGPSFTAVRQL